MEPTNPACPLHGSGIDPSTLLGRRLVRLSASWHSQEGQPVDGPVELWLGDDQGGSTGISIGTDWCLLVEASKPHDGFDAGGWGRIDVLPLRTVNPLASHFGAVVLGVREEWVPRTGRMALELDLISGSVRCESWGGDLRILAVERPTGQPDTDHLP
ncbi:hypothetical protein ACIGXM_01515 [Kitasatospora sp. NPDC052896]|uniref:hypothetical protein n=1 Tax=Kitasatospora sp. NPDC052896 TaxID=3364061 RepID=UPI0037CB1ACC